MIDYEWLYETRATAKHTRYKEDVLICSDTYYSYADIIRERRGWSQDDILYYRIALVRTTYHGTDQKAYLTRGRLPTHFTTPRGKPRVKVPKRFHEELITAIENNNI